MTFYSSAPAYPELFAVVGVKVPDFRGLFLRGVGGNSAGLGQAQGDAIRNITGVIAEVGGNWNVSASEAFFVGWSLPGGQHGNGGSRGQINFDASRQVPTADENRPVNKAVRYLVRALQPGEKVSFQPSLDSNQQASP